MIHGLLATFLWSETMIHHRDQTTTSLNSGALLLLAGLLSVGTSACGDDSSPSTDAGSDASTTDGSMNDAATDGAPADTGVDAAVPPPTVTVDSYITADQMLLANEINESGEPFAEALGYNLDDLDPAVPGSPDDRAYVLGIENYEYSRYQLATVVRNSGIGLHMMWAPMIRQAAAMEPTEFDGSMTGTPNGVNEDDELMKAIGMFAQLSNETPPMHAWPQFAEFAAGDPHMPQAADATNFAWTDVATMRWDRSLMDHHLVPAALGQTLVKQYLWAQDMLGAFHNAADEGIDATGSNSPDAVASPMFDPTNDIFYGGNTRDGFIGMVLTAEAINKVAFLRGALAYDGSSLGAIDLAAYDPSASIQYFPHAIAVTEAPTVDGLPPRMDSLTVSDDSSQLFDQASLLWGTTSFADMMAPDDMSDSAHMAYREVFDGSPFPASASETGTPGPYDLMKGTAKAIFMNLQAMHWDAAANVYVDEAHLTSAGVTRGTTVHTLDSAYLLVALEGFVRDFDGTPLKAAGIAAAQSQADFMVASLSDGAGTYFDQATIGSGHSTERGLLSQAAAVRGLYVAFRITGDTALKDAADVAYAKLIADYYDSASGLLRTTAGATTATYTPQNFAVLAGALREAALEGGVTDASNIYTAFFMSVGDRMQLSEGEASGESGGDSDGDGIPFIPEQPDRLPPIFASQAVFTLSE